MVLIPIAGDTFARRAAQLSGLHALAQRKDKQVAEIASGIIADDVSALWRLSAAYEWFQVDPRAALPHLRIFLVSPNSHSRLEAIMLLAQRQLPMQCLADLQQIHKTSGKHSLERVYAARALVAADQPEYLNTIRAAARLPISEPRDSHLQSTAITLLGECGTEDDVELLTSSLDSTDRVNAALALIVLLDRIQE